MFKQRFYTVQEVAKDLQVEDETVLAAIHRGDLEAINVAKDPEGKRPSWRIPELAKVEWFMRRSSANCKNQEQEALPEARPTRKPPKQIV